jgi:predicted secreted protein
MEVAQNWSLWSLGFDTKVAIFESRHAEGIDGRKFLRYQVVGGDKTGKREDAWKMRAEKKLERDPH